MAIRGFPPRRRPPPVAYRLEWRRLTIDPAGAEFVDLRFETARDRSRLREFAIAVSWEALGGEFRVSAPDGSEVTTCIDGLRRWDAGVEKLPCAKSASAWDADRRMASLTDRALTVVREAVLSLTSDGLMTAADALHVVAFARSLVRRSASGG